MALTITVRLLTGTYDAGDPDDRHRPEWPPHPARLFCGLVGAVPNGTDREALTWLERRSAPLVCVPAGHRPLRRTGYVVTNDLVTGSGGQTHPGRTNGLRTRSSTAIDPPVVCFSWTEEDPLPGTVLALERIARRVPYLGRSTGVAVLDVRATDAWFPPDRVRAPGGSTGLAALPAVPGTRTGTDTVVPVRSTDPTSPTDPRTAGTPRAPGEWILLEPCGLLDSEVALRVPYPGYLEDLTGLHQQGLPAWGAGRTCGYRTVPVPGPPPRGPRARAGQPLHAPMPTGYPDVVLFRFLDHIPSGTMASKYAAALRHRVLDACSEPVPDVLHGHGADGRPHVAFLAIPDAGYPHCDGHLLGLGVALPDLPEDVRRTVLHAVLGPGGPDRDRTLGIMVHGYGEFRLERVAGTTRTWGLTEQRWRRPCRRWASVTPVVLDRFPKRPQDLAAVIRRSCREAGLPDPVDLQVGTASYLPGGVTLSPPDLPRRARHRLYRHVLLEFDRCLTGPVLLGAGRYQGVGLLAPVPDGDAPRGREEERHGPEHRQTPRTGSGTAR